MLSCTTGIAASGKACSEHRPGAVVDPPAVHVGPDPGRMDDLADLVGELGQSRCGVLDVEQLGREAVEVVDGARSRHAVTAVALMYQCALITRIARGRGTAAPSACQAVV